MSNKSLEHAIKLAKTGNIAKAQELLKAVIASDHHNLPAWFWLVETCSTNKQRVDVLTICLEYNPDNEQAKQLLEKLQTLPVQTLMQSVSYKKTDGVLNISKESNLFAYLLIICLSIISGLLIASPYLVFLELNLLFTYQWGVTIPWVLLLLFIVVELLLPAPQKIHSGFIILSRLFSVVSVIILAFMIFLYYLPGGGELGLGILLVLVTLKGLGIIVPWFLIIPVTFSVQKIASLFLTQTSLDSIDPIVRIGIPWIFNVLGISALIFFIFR